MLRLLARFHGRKGAIGLFALSLTFSFFTAFHFDLATDHIVDVFNPIIHTKDLLARKLDDPTKRDLYAIASAQWEATYDEQRDYRYCALNQPLERPGHGCVTDPDTKIPYCQVRNMRIDTSKISGPLGGEPLDSVMGREEHVELPKYLDGAFSTSEKLELAEHMNRDYWFYLLEVFMAMDINPRQKCKTTLAGKSLVITRYEYVDMYHTLKDWWNAFMVLPEGGQKVDRVIFLDSHAHGYLDPIWNDLFGPTMHIKQIEEGTCLEQAIFIPPGYSSVLWPLGRKYIGNRCPAMSDAFVQFVIKSYGLEHIKKQENSVLILDHVKHIDHPRSAPEEHHDNSALMEMHTKILDQTEAVNVQVVDIQKLSFMAQLKLVRQAHILIGFQQEGSQLAHVMFLQDGASFIEVKTTGNDMRNVALWRPMVKYIPIYSTGSKLVDYEIVPNVKDVFTPGWDTTTRRYPEEYYSQRDYSEYNETELDTDDQFTEDKEEDMDSKSLLTGWGTYADRHDTAEDYRLCAMYGSSERPSHGCIVDPDTKIPYCQLEDFRIDSSKIKSPLGGERIDTVMGRAEDLEFPRYLEGALTVSKEIGPIDGLDKSMFYYLKDMMNAISTSPSQRCTQTVTTPTLFITRYEYVSLFHSLTDLWNAFFVVPEGSLKSVKVVFLDAHAEGFLDSVWTRVFNKYEYVKQLPEGGVCYKQAIFIPPGYSSALTPRDRLFSAKPCPSMTKAFVDHVVQVYGLEDEVVDQGRISILNRVPFLSHPRRDPSVERPPVSNLDLLNEKLEKSTNATTVEIVDMEQIPFLEVLRTMRRSHVVLGHNDAGLSHLIFMQEGTHVFELGSSRTAVQISKWKSGLTFRAFDALSGIDVKELDEETIEHDIVRAINYAVNRKDELEPASEKVADFQW